MKKILFFLIILTTQISQGFAPDPFTDTSLWKAVKITHEFIGGKIIIKFPDEIAKISDEEFRRRELLRAAEEYSIGRRLFKPGVGYGIKRKGNKLIFNPLP